MNVGYIKEKDMPFRIIDKFKVFLKQVTSVQFEEGIILEIPIFKKEKANNRVIKNLKKKIEKYKIDTILVSDKLEKESNEVYQKIKELSIPMLEGKMLMGNMIFDIWKYILNLQRVEIKQEDIYFLIKKELNFDLQFLSIFIENCKTVNIVTNDLERFQKIQKELYEKESILISVSNNKNKALKKAKYIFNINMSQNDLKKYKINRDAIIVNIKEKVKDIKNTFNGICVNDIEIKLPDEYIERFEKIGIEEFKKTKLYENILLKQLEIEKKKSIMISKSQLEKRKKRITDIIKKDEIKIIGLIGKNGRIDEREIMMKVLNKEISKGT